MGNRKKKNKKKLNETKIEQFLIERKGLKISNTVVSEKNEEVLK